MTGDEQKKEMMVIVRGALVLTMRKRKAHHSSKDDIRRGLPGMTWQQIRAMRIDNLDDGEDDSSQFSDEESDLVEVDVYKNVDEYVRPLRGATICSINHCFLSCVVPVCFCQASSRSEDDQSGTDYWIEGRSNDRGTDRWIQVRRNLSI
jgi:hypothetical protein